MHSKRNDARAQEVAELHTNPLLKISPASLMGSHTHDLIITKEAPDYEWRG